MKNIKRNQFITILALILFVIFSLFVYTDSKKIGVGKNQNDLQFNDEKEYKSLKISNIEKRKGSINHVLMRVRNTSNETFNGGYVVFHFVDKDGKDIDTKGFVLQKLAAKGEYDIDLVVKSEVLDAHNFVIKDK